MGEMRASLHAQRERQLKQEEADRTHLDVVDDSGHLGRVFWMFLKVGGEG